MPDNDSRDVDDVIDANGGNADRSGVAGGKPTLPDEAQAGQRRTLAPRRWWLIMPMIFITYSLAYLDRANYGFASAAGIDRDLHITSGASSLLGALFFLGYFFFQVPGAIYAERRSVKKLVLVSLIAWGVLAASTGMVSNVAALMVIRFFLGVVEAAVMPAMLIFISNWYTSKERSRANTYLILGNPVTILWMSVLSGYLVNSVGWRTMFVLEGVPAVIWAAIWWYFVQERPQDAHWMSESDKRRLAESLAAEQANLQPVRNYSQALRSRPVVILSLLYFCWCIGVYGFVLWLPSILKAGGAGGMVATGWLSSAPYLAAAIAMVVMAWASDRLQNRLTFLWPSLLVGALAFVGSYLCGPHHFWLAYAMLIIAGAAMYAPYGLFFAVVTELLPKNVAGGAMALINGMGALGSFVGSFVVGWLNGSTGSPGASYGFMAVALLLSVLLTFIIPGAKRQKSDPDRASGRQARAGASTRTAPAARKHT